MWLSWTSGRGIMFTDVTTNASAYIHPTHCGPVRLDVT